MQLSKYTTLQECTKSATAIKYGIDNTPNAEQIENLKAVCTNVFDKCREHLGGPLFISIGFRCKALNDKIPGASKTSQHMKGEALDLDCDVFKNGTNKELFEYIKNNLEFDQLIWEFGTTEHPEWVHVSFSRTKNRKTVLRSVNKGGKISYEKMV